MTIELSQELQTPLEYGPELPLEEPEQSSHSGVIRKALGAVAVVAGAAFGAWGAVGVLEPSAERTIGPGPVEATVGWGDTVDAVGITVADTRFIGADIDVSVDLSSENVDQSIQRLSPIAEKFENEGNEAAFKAFLQEYDEEIKGLATELGLKTTGLIALGAVIGAWSTLRILEKTGLRERPNDRMKRAKHVAMGTIVAVLGASAGVGYNVSEVANEDVQQRVIEELEQPFKEYLQTGTSKMAFNLDSLSSEARVQISRFLSITGSLSRIESSESQATHLWGVYADPHNLPTVPQILEAIGQSSSIDALLGLGDYNNTGAEFEINSLKGSDIAGVSFEGYDDIAHCEVWDQQTQSCEKEGVPIPHGAVVGNHDPIRMPEVFRQLGISDLDSVETFEGVPVLVIGDACYVDSSCLGDEYKVKNAEKGEEILQQMLAENKPLPKTGFFASYEAAKPFYGHLETLIVGGRHEFKVFEEEGSTIVEVGSIGQGFPRMSDEASMILLDLDDEGSMKNCINISWQTLKRETPRIEACESAE